MSRTPFRETLIYPVFFMLVACIIFVGLLAFMYRSSEPKIEANQKDSYQKLIMQLFSEDIAKLSGDSALTIMASYPESFNAYIKEIKIPGVERRCFTATFRDSLLGFCFDIGGKGLWGSMRALVALTPDLNELQGIFIYDQMETPGLGARIGESWFRDQFKNLSVLDSSTGKVPNFELIPEGKKAESAKQIMQVTGATITTNSVIKMLTDEINYIHTAFHEVKS
jgi:Na+-transporting NADH:ubiquinone oxidoreductase subunit C